MERSAIAWQTTTSICLLTMGVKSAQHEYSQRRGVTFFCTSVAAGLHYIAHLKVSHMISAANSQHRLQLFLAAYLLMMHSKQFTPAPLNLICSNQSEPGKGDLLLLGQLLHPTIDLSRLSWPAVS
eukprot:c7324_g1_i1 orf=383-757(+)